MSGLIKHRHQTAVASVGADVDKTEWNDSHIFSGGTDGQIASRDSAQADGWKWIDPPSATLPGYPVLLEEHAASGGTTITFSARNKNPSVVGTGVTFQSDYDVYLIDFINILLATNDQGIVANVSTNGGASYDTSAIYGRGYQYGATNNATNGGGEVSQTRWNITGNQTNTATHGMCGQLKLFNPTGTTSFKQMVGEVIYGHSTVDWLILQCGFVWKNSAAFNAMQFSTSAGNITGTVRVSGVTK
jgi:hypothetical protein